MLLALALFINYVDRGALPTAAHLIQIDLQLSTKQLGVLFSAFFWTYSLMQVPVGWLAERYGAHRVLMAALALWASATMLVGLAHTFTSLLLLRLLLGIGESAGFPCVSKLLAAVVPVNRLGTANGIVACGYLFGPAVGTYGGGLIEDRFGWRAAFMVLGSLSLLWLIPWGRVRLPPLALRRSVEDRPTLWTILKERSLWGTCLGLFSGNYTFYFILSWLPLYLVRERGFSTLDMAKIASSAYVVNALSALATGWATDRLISRGASANTVYKGTMAITYGGSIACMSCMAFGSPLLALAAMYVYQIVCGACSPGAYAIPQILAGARAAGRWVGIQNSVGNLAGIVAPAATGYLIGTTHHFTSAFVLAAAFGVIGLIGWILMLPPLQEIAWNDFQIEKVG